MKNPKRNYKNNLLFLTHEMLSFCSQILILYKTQVTPHHVWLKIRRLDWCKLPWCYFSCLVRSFEEK
jgi:hypothetical protein